MNNNKLLHLKPEGSTVIHRLINNCVYNDKKVDHVRILNTYFLLLMSS